VDKRNRNHAGLILAGLILIFAGVFFFYLHLEAIINLVLTTSGITLLISGIKYKDRRNTRVVEPQTYPLTGEARKAYLKSVYFITSMIGVVILIIGLGGGLLIREMGLWFLLVDFFGMLLLFAGRLVKAADKK
jgi:hypothetical protein